MRRSRVQISPVALEQHTRVLPIPTKTETRWRRERDLNPRGKIPRDFQSRALPGYAISARDLRVESYV